MSEALLALDGVGKDFTLSKRAIGGIGRTQTLRAVDSVSLQLAAGDTLGIVGESGCGKTTLARLMLRLLKPSRGSIYFAGEDITHLPEQRLRQLRRHIQVVFQDPYSSLNPRLKVRDLIAEPLVNFGYSRARIDTRVAEVLQVVGLALEYADRYPHAFSGGQRQRIGIARALAPAPRLMVCDEAVSALDVSVQAQVLNLFADIQREFSLSLVFISHNLGVVRHVSHRIAVMYLGKIVELATEARLFAAAQHPYTQALIAAVPEPDPSRRGRRQVLAGDIPSPLAPPPGCAFQQRCPRAQARCRSEPPPLRPLAPDHAAACHYPGA